jgi:hypothetical protein
MQILQMQTFVDVDIADIDIGDAEGMQTLVDTDIDDINIEDADIEEVDWRRCRNWQMQILEV